LVAIPMCHRFPQCPRPDEAALDTTYRCYLSVLTELVG